MDKKYKNRNEFLKDVSKSAREDGGFSKIKRFLMGEDEEKKKKKERDALIEKERQKSYKQR